VTGVLAVHEPHQPGVDAGREAAADVHVDSRIISGSHDRGRAASFPSLPALPRWVLGYTAGNAAALLLVLYAATRPWVVAAGESPVPASLVRSWIPFALALATIVDLAIAAVLAPERRAAFLARHFALYLVGPLTLLFLYLSAPVANADAGAFCALLVIAFALNALHGIAGALDRLSDRRAAMLIGAAALAAYLAVVPYHRAVQPTASDEPHYLIVMQSLVDDRDLDLANDYAGDRYLRFYPAKLEDIHGIHVGAAIYSIRDLGLPFLGAIPFALGGRTGVLALIAVAGAVLALQLYLLLRDLAFAPRVALLATAATAFVHPLFTYTSQVYPELLAALAFVTAARLLRRGTLTTARELALASAALGALPWLTTRAWPIVLGVGLCVAWRAFRPFSVARVAAGALPFALLVLALCALNWRTFGLFMPAAGYYLIREQQEVLALAPQTGTLGLFFDRDFGLIGRAPVYLLAFLGIATLVRRARDGHGALLVPLALGWLLSLAYIADIAYWWADGSPQSRYLVATMPFLIAGVAGGIEAIAALRRSRALAAGLAWAAAAWSIFITFGYATLPTLGYDLALEIRSGRATGRLWEWVGRVVRPDPGLLFPSLVRVDASTVALSALWVAVGAALVVIGWRAGIHRLAGAPVPKRGA